MYPQRSVMTCGLATALEPPHFNHAPAWGATKVWFSTTEQPESFNPRTRVGCDPFAARHLPCLSCFNPRTRVGCDRRTLLSRACTPVFQSTHPRGVRHARGPKGRSP